MMRKILNWLSFLLLLTILVGGIWMYDRLPEAPSLPQLDPEQSVSVHTIVIEEVIGLGKMELAQYTFRDVVTHTNRTPYQYLPDPKVMLKVYGETVACVDFTQVQRSDIQVQGEVLTLDLPAPEICYSRIDHERSEIVETWFTALYANGQRLIDQAYTIGERRMRETALDNDIYGEAQRQAQLTLVPLLENLTGKQVVLRFASFRGGELPPIERSLDSFPPLEPKLDLPADSLEAIESEQQPAYIRE